MEDADTPGAGRDLVAEAQELADMYQVVLTKGMMRYGDLNKARGHALGNVTAFTAAQAAERERHRIASALMRRSIDLGIQRRPSYPAETQMGDPLEIGLRVVVPWRWMRRGIARVLYRVLAEMVRNDQV